jgi:hypothetical protein
MNSGSWRRYCGVDAADIYHKNKQDMRHVHTFESFLNESKPLFKKEGDAEISVKTSDADKLENTLKSMKLDFENLGKKDSTQLTFYKILNTNWDALNKVGEKVKLQSMTINE